MRTLLFTAPAALVALAGCAAGPRTPGGAGGGAVTTRALFRDVAGPAGLRFVHTNGATDRFHFIETTPAGCALFDLDNDGFLDIFLVQSGHSMPPDPTVERPRCALYRNNRDRTFTDITPASGFDRDLGYGHGLAAGDYDNDGFSDLFLTSYGGNHLFRNDRGSGRFLDVTVAAGLGRLHSTGYATSAAFGDYDNDGRLDLYVCYYCPWNWEKHRPCHDARRRPDYCSPDLYDPDVHRLYRNEGRRFADVTQESGIASGKGRGLAVAFVDYDEDGRQDIFVANDMTPNMLWRNRDGRTFENVAPRAGCAYSEGGSLMAGMGIAIGDYDHSGRESLFVTNFSGLPNTLFRNIGDGSFQDASMVARLALPHMKFLAFGCEFFDYDADGWLDLLVANGHVQIHADTTLEGVTFKERKQLFHNERDSSFSEVTDSALLGELGRPTVSRGLAVGDFDNDGRLDALFSNQNDPVQLFRNMDRSGNHWVCFQTIGTKSNREGRHARFTVTAGGMRQVAVVRAGSSYLSHSDRRVYFGLGAAQRIKRVEIRWPGGTRQIMKDIPADAIYVVTEGRGITATRQVKSREQPQG